MFLFILLLIWPLNYKYNEYSLRYKTFFNSFDLDSSIGNETPECFCTHASVGNFSFSPYLYNMHAHMRFLDAFSTKALV